MSRTLSFLWLLVVGASPLHAEESTRRRPVRADADWPAFDAGRPEKGFQIGMAGLAKMEPDSALRLDLARSLFSFLLEAGDLDAAGAWLKREPSLSLSCVDWARLALEAARNQNSGVWTKAKEAAERLAAIGSMRDGREGWVLLYEGALLAEPKEAERFLGRVAADDFDSQSDLKCIKIRRMGEGLDPKMNDFELNTLLAPPPTGSSLDLMGYALQLVKLIQDGVCEGGRVPFAPIANQAIKCAVESAANPAPVFVGVLAESSRIQEELPLKDWQVAAVKWLDSTPLDEDKASHLLEMAEVAGRLGDPKAMEEFKAESERCLSVLEPALQPEGYFRLGQTHVRQGDCESAWKVWSHLVQLLESNPNKDLECQLRGQVALEIECWPGNAADLKVKALSAMELEKTGAN
jgi:hypothetical protein